MMLTAPCLIHWKLHQTHGWAYASTGGGHMVTLGSTDEKGYAEWHCLGIAHIPRHRGTPRHPYSWVSPHTGPKHRGTPVEESDLTTLDGIPIL